MKHGVDVIRPFAEDYRPGMPDAAELPKSIEPIALCAKELLGRHWFWEDHGDHGDHGDHRDHGSLRSSDPVMIFSHFAELKGNTSGAGASKFA